MSLRLSPCPVASSRTCSASSFQYCVRRNVVGFGAMTRSRPLLLGLVTSVPASAQDLRQNRTASADRSKPRKGHKGVGVSHRSHLDTLSVTLLRSAAG